MNEDMSQYLGVFLDEANEQMELLEQDILALEQHSTQELLQEIFRAAHTLKGSSRAMGFTTMGELTHAMEDVFDKLRHEELTVSGELIDALFAGLDTLKALKEEVASTGSATLDTAVQTARLRAVLEGNSAAPAAKVPGKAAAAKNSAPPKVAKELPLPATNDVVEMKTVLTATAQMAVQEALGANCSIYGVVIKIAPDCVMKSVRSLMVLQALEHVGSILATTPGEEALENEQFDSEFEVVIATERDIDVVRAAAGNITEVTSATVLRWPGTSAPETESVTDGSEASLVISSETQVALDEATKDGQSSYSIAVKIAPDCVMKSVRALMVLQALEHVGSILATTPSEEALEGDDFGNSFEVLLVSSVPPGTIRDAAGTVNEITEITIGSWSPTGADSSEVVPEAEAVVVAPVQDERESDAGPEARGKTQDEVKKIAAEKTEKKVVAQPQTVRVDVARLDKLLNLVGELVIDRTRVAQIGGQFERQYQMTDLIESLNETAAHIGRITDELQEEIMKARMLPIDNVFSRFPRMVRDLAQKLGKEIEFEIEGKETELDRSVIEVIGDPLIHMLRNSVDHGIEMPEERKKAGKSSAGTVWLRARHEENHIVIEIQDDGKGMDPNALRANAVKKGVLTHDAAARLTDKEAINLIFAPGFSTAAVVSDVSGRGVGMDIVRSNLQKLGALIDIESKIGEGSTFTVKLPLTLAIIRGLLVTVRGCVYALPLASVVETLKISLDDVHRINHREVILQRGRTLPIVRLRDVFHMEAATTPAERNLSEEAASVVMQTHAVTAQARQATNGDDEEKLQARSSAVVRTKRVKPESLYLVVVGMGEKQVGLVVDSLIGEQEVVIKTLGKFIGDIRGISGATILGDGRVALIVDINGIIHVAMEEKGKAHAA